MSVPFPQINRSERDALNNAIVTDLPHVVDVVLAIGRSEYALARVLRTRYEAELLLLDDLDWTPTVPGLDRFELTSRRGGSRTHCTASAASATGGIVEYFEADPATPLGATAQARLEHDTLVADVCDRLLGQLVGPFLEHAEQVLVGGPERDAGSVDDEHADRTAGPRTLGEVAAA